MPDKLEFDDEGSRLVEEFNSSPQAQERRRRIADALAPRLGESILDVGSGPGNQVYEMATIVGASGEIVGADPEDSAIEIASQRCREFSNVRFEQASLPNLPFEDATFDAVMSSQVFEYLDDHQRISRNPTYPSPRGPDTHSRYSMGRIAVARIGSQSNGEDLGTVGWSPSRPASSPDAGSETSGRRIREGGHTADSSPGA